MREEIQLILLLFLLYFLLSLFCNLIKDPFFELFLRGDQNGFFKKYFYLLTNLLSK